MEFIKKEWKEMELEIDERGKHLVNKIERGLHGGLQKMKTKMDEKAERHEKELKKMEMEMMREWNSLSNKTKRKAKKMKIELVVKVGDLTNRMIQGMQKKKPLVWARVDRSDLRPGDHIFINRICGSYSHHGIYIGGGLVIHFTRPKGKQEIMSPKPPCGECKHQVNTDRSVVKTCVGCFLKEDLLLTGHTLHRYLYGVSEFWFLFRKRGTCSKLPSKSPEEVVEIAEGLFKSDGFGKYDITENNCESFATFCKTGYKQSSQVDTMAYYIKVLAFNFGVVGCLVAFGHPISPSLFMMLLLMRLMIDEAWDYSFTNCDGGVRIA